MECFNKISLFTWLSNAFSLFHKVSEKSDVQLLPCVASAPRFSKEMIKSTSPFPPPAPGQASSSNEACHKQWFVQRAVKVKNHTWGPFWKSISVTFGCCKDEEAAGSTCLSPRSCHHSSLTVWPVPVVYPPSRVCRVHPECGKKNSWAWETHHCCVFSVFTLQAPNEDGVFDSRSFHLELRLNSDSFSLHFAVWCYDHWQLHCKCLPSELRLTLDQKYHTELPRISFSGEKTRKHLG